MVTQTIKSEGEEKLISLAGAGAYIAPSITVENVNKFLKHIDLATHIENMQVQVFPGYPKIWVEDENGDVDDELTGWLKTVFRKVNAYPSMQITWYECMAWGASVKSPGYAKVDGRYEVTEIRNLPAHSFSQYPGEGDIQNDLMPGIIINSAGETEVYQANPTTLNHIKITNFIIITDPTAPKPAGEAYMLPVYPVIAAINFANKAADQQIGRIGAPSIFPALPRGGAGLEDWAKSFIANWGKNTSFVIPDKDVEFLDPHIRENRLAEDRLKFLGNLIDSFFNPTTVLDKSGSSIGSSDKGASQIWSNYISGTQSWIEEAYEAFFARMFVANGYEGKIPKIELKRPELDRSTEKREQVKVGILGKALTIKDIRDNLSELDLQELTPEIERALKSQYQSATLPQGFGNVAYTPEEEQIISDTEAKLNKIHDATSMAIQKLVEMGQ